MSRKKNVFFEYGTFHHDGDAESDEDKAPSKPKRTSIFDFVSYDREMTEISASTTMTALDVASIMSSPSKDRQQADARANTQHNVDQIMTAISTMSKQLSDCGGSFVDLQKRMAKLEATISPTMSNGGTVVKTRPEVIDSSAFEHHEGSAKENYSDHNNSPIRSKSSKLRYIHYKLRKNICVFKINFCFRKYCRAYPSAVNFK